MKASDLVTTSEQKVLAGERLLFTEQTDAVNTGLVNSADKSGSVLKDRQLPTGGPSSTGRRPPMADGPQPPRGRRTRRGWRTISDGQAKNPNAPDASLTAQTHRHMAAAMGKRTAATAAGAVVHNTLQDTELDGADNLYYETKGTVSGAKAVYRAIRKRLGASRNRPEHARRAVAWTECCVTARTARRTAGESYPHRAIPLAVCPRRNT